MKQRVRRGGGYGDTKTLTRYDEKNERKRPSFILSSKHLLIFFFKVKASPASLTA